MDILQQIIVLAILFFSITLHEYSHGAMAKALGDDTAERAGRLTLNPIAHIDLFGTILLPLTLFFTTGGRFIFGWAKPVPYNPDFLKYRRWGDAIVAAAGPLTNLVIALGCGLVIRFLDQPSIFANSWAPTAANFFSIVASLNIILALFNLLPIPPLDGSKILTGFLPEFGKKILYYFERLGPLFGLLIIFLFLEILWPFLANWAEAVFGLFSGRTFPI